MKKVILSAVLLGAFLVSCENDSLNSDNPLEVQEVQVDMSDFSLYVDQDDLAGKSADSFEKCVSMKNLEYRLAKNSGLAKKMYDIEYNTRKAIALKGNGKGKPGSGGGGGGTTSSIFEGAITIPVVVNIIEQFSGQVTQS